MLITSPEGGETVQQHAGKTRTPITLPHMNPLVCLVQSAGVGLLYQVSYAVCPHAFISWLPPLMRLLKKRKSLFSMHEPSIYYKTIRFKASHKATEVSRWYEFPSLSRGGVKAKCGALKSLPGAACVW